MAHPRPHRSWIFGVKLRATAAGPAFAIIILLTIVATQAAQAQTFTVLHNFTGGLDGGVPTTGLTMDASGNLYGTTQYGGGAGCNGSGCGTIFKLKHSGPGWIFSPLYSFAGGNDGAVPVAGVIIGPNGSLYGTTNQGGGVCNCGTVFNLRPAATPPLSVFSPWTETVLYRFTGSPDGAYPRNGELVFDHAGYVYGTTVQGGPLNAGTVYQVAANGGSEQVIFSFGDPNYGYYPYGGVIFDPAGNLYGATGNGSPYGNGTVYELTNPFGSWVENLLWSFSPGGSDGVAPVGGLVFDPSGDLYGTSSSGGSGAGGTVFKLHQFISGGWTFTVLYSFTDTGSVNNPGPRDSLFVDAGGDLYGTTLADGAYGYGSVFRLTPSQGVYTYTDLHDFTGGGDGGYPKGNVILHSNGKLYGTASSGGSHGNGVVFEITP